MFLFERSPREIDAEIRSLFKERYSEEHLKKTEDVIANRRYRNKIINLIRDLSALHFNAKDILQKVSRIPSRRIRTDWAEVILEVLTRDL